MKTVTISTTVEEYDTRCIYVLPPLVGSSEMNGQQENDKALASAAGVVHQCQLTSEFGTVMGGDQQMTVRVVSPSHDQSHDNDDDRRFITQVNVPSGRKTCAGEPFSSQLVVDRFSETVALPVLSRPLGPRQSCASFCNYESARRYKESMRLEPSLTAAQFNVSMVCYPGCTKKRYRTTVHCATKLRPRNFGATSFIQPKRKDDRFISYVDYGADSTRRWHTTAITVRPRTACSNFVHGFQFIDGAWSGEDVADCLDDLESFGSSGFLEDEGGSSVGPGQSDLQLNLSNGDLGRMNGYRAHMVVGGE